MSEQKFHELTEDQAISLVNSGFWEAMSYRDRAEFQLFARRLCMPFNVFHEALEKALGRPVWTHEMGMNWEGLISELRGEKPAPTMQEILGLIPAEKRIILTT